MSDLDRLRTDVTWRQWSSRQRMSPFPNYLSMEAVCNESQALFGTGYTRLVMSFQRNDMAVFGDVAETDRVGQGMLTRLDEEPALFVRMEREIEHHGAEFLSWVTGLKNQDLPALTDTELADLFTTYARFYQTIYPRYFGIILAEGALVDALQGIIASRKLDETTATELFTTLTREPKAMVNLQEEVARWALAADIESNTEWSNFFNEPATVVAQLDAGTLPTQLTERITAHQAAFYWVTRDYEDPILTVTDVVDRLATDLTERRFEQLTSKRTLIDHHDDAIRDAEATLKLTPAESTRFRQMREGMAIKEQRKRIVSESLYHFDIVLAEVAKRAQLTVPLVRFLAMSEVPAALAGQLTRAALEERFTESFWILQTDQPPGILAGAAAQPWHTQLLAIDDSVTELKGLGISGGVATGVARLMINPNESDTVKAGEIIVTVQAVPSFSAAISRASGIVADGGTGLTSHTATLAREAKIPGVTGVKIGTKVIRDGDTIEVNGNQGIVTIIKRA